MQTGEGVVVKLELLGILPEQGGQIYSQSLKVFGFFPTKWYYLRHAIYTTIQKQQQKPHTTLPYSTTSSTSDTICVFIYYVHIWHIYVPHIHKLFNFCWAICTAVKVIPGASALFPDTDLQGKLYH